MLASSPLRLKKWKQCGTGKKVFNILLGTTRRTHEYHCYDLSELTMTVEIPCVATICLCRLQIYSCSPPHLSRVNFKVEKNGDGKMARSTI